MFILDEKISLERLASFSNLDFSHNLNIEAHSKDYPKQFIDSMQSLSSYQQYSSQS